MKLLRAWWDLETSGLEADWDNILAIGYQVEGEKVNVLQINDFPKWNPWDDKRLIQEFLKVLNRPDVGLEIGHNTTLFDIPYLQARMARNGLGVFPVIGHVDTYFIAKSKLRISSKSLKNISEFLGCPFSKTPLSPEIWRRAARGDEASLEQVGRKHCGADIKVTHWVYDQLAPLMRRHPFLGSHTNCPVCASDKLIKRGPYTTTLRGLQIRYECKNCGHQGHMTEKEWEKR